MTSKQARSRRGQAGPGTGLATAGVALAGAGIGLAWLTGRMGPPDAAPPFILAVPILAGLVLFYAGLIIYRWRAGPMPSRHLRWRSAAAGEPLRGWRRLGIGLLLLGLAGLGILLAQRGGAFGAWAMSGASIAAGVAILVRLRMTRAD